MPTRLRVDLAVYHHPDDKKMFLQIINKAATLHKITLTSSY